jgi:uncharacterized protein (TIGR02453 family)
MEFRQFEPTLLEFLEELTDHNERRWFLENKRRYELDVLEPSLAFIRAFRPRLAKISRSFVASDRRVGGSLMRVYRDQRFLRGGGPYKTNVGIQFRHEAGADVHAPGFYVHIEPDACFLALGVWHPDAAALAQIRQAILERPEAWRRARNDARFRRTFELQGDSLRRPPHGIPPDHPLVEDLKRKDFIAVADLTEQQVLDRRFLDRVAEAFAAGRPLVRFLCAALRLPF